MIQNQSHKLPSKNWQPRPLLQRSRLRRKRLLYWSNRPKRNRLPRRNSRPSRKSKLLWNRRLRKISSLRSIKKQRKRSNKEPLFRRQFRLSKLRSPSFQRRVIRA